MALDVQWTDESKNRIFYNVKSEYFYVESPLDAAVAISVHFFRLSSSSTQSILGYGSPRRIVAVYPSQRHPTAEKEDTFEVRIWRVLRLWVNWDRPSRSVVT